MLNHHRVGRGEPLVLIHGIGSQWQLWLPLFERLAPHREVIAIDLPGFGDSPVLPAGVEPTPYALTDAVVEFLDELDLERPLVAGNSLGGQVAIQLARRGRVRAAVPISPVGFQLPRERAWSTGRLYAEVHLGRLLLRAAPRAVRSPAVRAAMFAGMIARPSHVPADAAIEMSTNFARSPGFDATLRALHRFRFEGGDEVRVPVTMVWGDRDFLLIPRQAERATRLLPTARLVWLKGAGHVPTYDAPDEIADILLAA